MTFNVIAVFVILYGSLVVMYLKLRRRVVLLENWKDFRQSMQEQSIAEAISRLTSIAEIYQRGMKPPITGTSSATVMRPRAM